MLSFIRIFMLLGLERKVSFASFATCWRKTIISVGCWPWTYNQTTVLRNRIYLCDYGYSVAFVILFSFLVSFFGWLGLNRIITTNIILNAWYVISITYISRLKWIKKLCCLQLPHTTHKSILGTFWQTKIHFVSKKKLQTNEESS